MRSQGYGHPCRTVHRHSWSRFTPPQHSSTIPHQHELRLCSGSGERRGRIQWGAGAQLGDGCFSGSTSGQLLLTRAGWDCNGCGVRILVWEKRGCVHVAQELLLLLQMVALERNWHLQTLDMQPSNQGHRITLDKGNCQTLPLGEKQTKCFLTFV